MNVDLKSTISFDAQKSDRKEVGKVSHSRVIETRAFGPTSRLLA